MPQKTFTPRAGKIWLSENIQSFFDWTIAVQEIRGKSLVELAALKAQMLSGPEGERKPVFGDGRQDYMMQRYKNLALISISGTLVKNDSPWNKYYNQVSYDEIRRSCLLALTDRTVEGIMLVMNTPGGSASGADAMAGFFSKSNKTKPLYAFAESDMCSGGYYLGAPAREIYAQRAAMVGSIGVVMVHYDLLDMYKEMGITPTVFRAGEFKALGSSVEHLDKKAIASLNGMMEDYFAMFNDHVVEHRNYDSVADLLASGGDGRVFMAEAAKEVGLVDQVAEFEDALEQVSNKAAKVNGGQSNFQVTTNLQRNSTMGKGTAKPAAQAQAGTDLTPEVIAALAAGANLGEIDTPVETAKPAVEGGEQDPELGAGDTPEPVVEEPVAEPEVAAAAPAAVAAAATDAVLLDKVLNLNTELATLKTQLAASQAEAVKLRDADTAKQAQIDSLSAIARIAVSNRQVALGFQPSDTASLTCEQLVSSFNQLDTDFKARFKEGQRSKPTQEAVKPVTLTPNEKAARNMTGKL